MISIVLIPTQASVSAPTTAVFFLGDLRQYSLQAVFTGSNVAGTFSLNQSNDGVNYIAVPDQSTSVTDSTGTILGDSGANYGYVQASWAYTSGTGNITVTLVAKEFHLSHN